MKWSPKEFFFHEVDKIASGISYNTLRLWEIHDFFMIISKICENCKDLSHEYKSVHMYMDGC